jgi:putative Holliday junction resolvase
MPIFNLSQLRAGLSRHQRLIGIDPGQRIIGIALSDVTLMLASPYRGIPRAKLAVNTAEIKAIAEKEGAGGLVVGLPLGLDGSFGPAAQAAKDWATALSDATGLPAALWDERLSSSAVNRMLIQEADLTRAKRGRAVDAAAAAYMLQSALDASRPAPETGRPGT